MTRALQGGARKDTGVRADLDRPGGGRGVVHVDQTRRSGGDYERARAWTSREANAAALGAWATRVVVDDSHATMRDLLFEELDPRVEVISGALKLLPIVQGFDAGQPDAASFVGDHGGAGLRASVIESIHPM
ncbi:M55 family metallopeptidase [Sorangium sp. So ce448]|uniref:M55 family metallopeptidase n=1 Tax=Sorangium sp. So ce448 TaxID=3133314 RepID=UPI003F635272